MFANRRLTSQRGQTSAEIAGILVLIAAVFVALFSTPLGSQISGSVQESICQILTGKSCEPPEGNEETGVPPLSECVRDSATRGVEGSVKFATIKGSLKLNGVKEVRADGTTRVTFDANAELGWDPGAKGATVATGKDEAGAGGGVNISGNLGGSVAFNFDSEEDADKFISDVKKKAIAIADPTPNIGDDDADIDLPEPDMYTVQGGVQGSLSGKMGGAGLEGNLSGTGGITFDNENDKKTIFLEVGAGGSIDAAGLAGAEGKGKGRVAITLDENNEPESVRFIGTLEGTVSDFKLDSTKFKEATLTELTDAAKRNKVVGADNTGGRVIFDANLRVDKDHPENRAALNALLSGQGLTPLVQRYDEDGTLNVKTYTLDTDKYGGGFDIGVAGLEGYYNTEDAEIADAYYRSKTGGGWTRWEDCVNGLKK